MKIKILSIIWVLLVAQNSFATIESISIYKTEKSDKRVIIVGDLHVAILEGNKAALIEEDKVDYKLILRWLAQIAESKSKTKFYSECAEWNLENFKVLKIREGYQCLIFELGLLIQQANCKIQNIDFSFDESRTKGSIEFNLFIKEICLQLMQQIKSLKPEMVREFIKLCKQDFCNNRTFEDLINEVQERVESIKKQLANLPVGNVFAIFLDNQFNKFKDALKKFDIKSSPVDFFIEAIRNSKDDIKNTLRQLLVDTTTMYDWLIELDFIVNLFKDLQKYDTVILYIGNAHAMKLNKYLTEIYNLEVIVQSGEFSDKDLSGKRKVPVEKLMEIFGLDKQDCKLTIEQLEKKLLELNINKNCAKCTKANCTNRCGKCKKVYYCSADCQRAHWKAHKPNCI